MVNWNINLNGKPYSLEVTGRGVKAAEALARWKEQHAALGYGFPVGEFTATKYVESRLDHYGSKRGG